jgi:uncharacterized protein YndB with AHSA1/START domain
MKITVDTTIDASIEKVWECWTLPEHITGWNFASDDWCSPSAQNDLREGSYFSWRMEAKDGSMGFDFSGKYTRVLLREKIEYILDDGRHVIILFKPVGEKTKVTETFETENIYPPEKQREGWQSILNNFKKYVEE